MAWACPYLPLILATPPPPSPRSNSIQAFVGHLSFCFEKAANAPRWPVRSYIYENPTVGLKNTVQMRDCVLGQWWNEMHAYRFKE